MVCREDTFSVRELYSEEGIQILANMSQHLPPAEHAIPSTDPRVQIALELYNTEHVNRVVEYLYAALPHEQLAQRPNLLSEIREIDFEWIEFRRERITTKINDEEELRLIQASGADPSEQLLLRMKNRRFLAEMSAETEFEHSLFDLDLFPDGHFEQYDADEDLGDEDVVI
jgi:hypothetical protein